MSTNRKSHLVDLSYSIEPPQTLPDRVYSVLKYRILTCAVAPGQRLNEKDIAEELRVSRTPLREALNRLAQESLLTRIPYCGYAVAPVTKDDIANLCELRFVVETAAAELAAERATPEEIGHLSQSVELQYTPGDRKTYPQYLKANSIFHRGMARASHNGRLESMVMSILDELQRPLYLGLDMGLNAENATKEHVELVDAITSHDPGWARRIHGEHIRAASDRMIAAIQAKGLLSAQP